MYPSKGGNWGEPYDGGFIGPAHTPMNLVEKDPLAKVQNLALRDITLDRLEDRTKLRAALQNYQRAADAVGEKAGVDTYHQQALDILTGSKLTDALDLSSDLVTGAHRTYAIRRTRVNEVTRRQAVES